MICLCGGLIVEELRNMGLNYIKVHTDTYMSSFTADGGTSYDTPQTPTSFFILYLETQLYTDKPPIFVSPVFRLFRRTLNIQFAWY